MLAYIFVPILYRFGKFCDQKLYSQSGRGHQK